MIDALYLGVRCQERNDLFCILRMPFQPQRQRFHPLQEQERVKRRYCRARIAQQNRTDVGDKRR